MRPLGKILLLFVLLSLVSCASKRAISRPEWRLQGIRIDHIDLSKVRLAIEAHITNPNPFSVTILKAHYQFYMGETLIAQGEKTEPFDLPGAGETDVLLPVEISLAAMSKIAPLLKNDPGNNDLHWRLEGECTLKVFGVERVFPFKKEEGKKKAQAPTGGGFATASRR